MAAKFQIVTAIDVGTSKVATVVAKIYPKGHADPHDPGLRRSKSAPESLIEIIAVGSAPTQGIRKGVVVHIEDVARSIAESVSQAEKMGGIQIRSALVSISGAHLEAVNSSGMVAIKNREVRSSDIQSVIDVARSIPMNHDRELIHVLLQDFIIDGQDGVQKPLGISGSRLETRVHVISGLTASIQNHIKAFNKAGIAVSDVIVSAVSSSRSVVSENEKKEGVCVIDIGAGTTDVSVFIDGSIHYTACLPIGGNHISNDISIGLKIPLLIADKIKHKNGAALRAIVGRNESIEIAVPANGSSIAGSTNARVFSKYALSEIIEARIREILHHVYENISQVIDIQELRSGIVLAGGVANLIGISQVAEQKFRLPVRIGSPVSVNSSSARIGGQPARQPEKHSSLTQQILMTNAPQTNGTQAADSAEINTPRLETTSAAASQPPLNHSIEKLVISEDQIKSQYGSFEFTGLTDSVNLPEYASVLGMILYALDSNANFYSAASGDSPIKFAKRIFSWFTEHF